MPLINALESRLAQSGGMNAVVPQNSSSVTAPSSPVDAPQVQTITSGRDLLDRAKVLARYLNEQPQGWLSAHRLMKTLRWDTVHELPPDVDGKTRLAPPRTESRNQLKRLYAQQNWTELLEQADLMFSTGVSHFWLDIQWYLHQALTKAGVPWDRWTAVIRQDTALLLERLRAGKSGIERRHTVRRRGDAQLDSAAGHDAGRRRMACGESRCTDRRRHK